MEVGKSRFPTASHPAFGLDVLGAEGGPTDPRADQREQRRDDDGADREGVQQDPETDDDALLGERDQWQYTEHTEHRRQRDSGAGDDGPGRREGGRWCSRYQAPPGTRTRTAGWCYPTRGSRVVAS